LRVLVVVLETVERVSVFVSFQLCAVVLFLLFLLAKKGFSPFRSFSNVFWSSFSQVFCRVVGRTARLTPTTGLDTVWKASHEGSQPITPHARLMDQHFTQKTTKKNTKKNIQKIAFFPYVD
jgi:hypothetical protein